MLSQNTHLDSRLGLDVTLAADTLWNSRYTHAGRVSAASPGMPSLTSDYYIPVSSCIKLLVPFADEEEEEEEEEGICHARASHVVLHLDTNSFPN